jgi:hypothetical protein
MVPLSSPMRTYSMLIHYFGLLRFLISLSLLSSQQKEPTEDILAHTPSDRVIPSALSLRAVACHRAESAGLELLWEWHVEPEMDEWRC